MRGRGPVLLRLFVAVYPASEVARAMLGLLDEVELGEHRVTPSEQVHMTLQFVGDTPSGKVEEVVETVRRAAGGIEGFVLQPRRLITLPERGGARLMALETDGPPPLLELQRRLASRLARKARREKGDRFLPHLTLCRFREGAQVERVDREVEVEGFAVREVKVVRSVLRPSGAEHAVVGSVGLG
ncbi:MAG: RNA 2',3'-cyclic phosphodiesterase [Phycisphaerales bacterium]